MISMTATLPRIHDRPTSSQLASSVVVVEHRPPPHDRDLGLRRALAVVDLLQHGHEALVGHLSRGGGAGREVRMEGMGLSVPQSRQASVYPQAGAPSPPAAPAVLPPGSCSPRREPCRASQVQFSKLH